MFTLAQAAIAEEIENYRGKSEEEFLKSTKAKSKGGWTLGMATAEAKYTVGEVLLKQKKGFILEENKKILDIVYVGSEANTVTGHECSNKNGDSFTEGPREKNGLSTDAAFAILDKKKSTTPETVYVVNMKNKKFEKGQQSQFNCGEATMDME